MARQIERPQIQRVPLRLPQPGESFSAYSEAISHVWPDASQQRLVQAYATVTRLAVVGGRLAVKAPVKDVDALFVVRPEGPRMTIQTMNTLETQLVGARDAMRVLNDRAVEQDRNAVQRPENQTRLQRWLMSKTIDRLDATRRDQLWRNATSIMKRRTILGQADALLTEILQEPLENYTPSILNTIAELLKPILSTQEVGVDGESVASAVAAAIAMEHDIAL
jgi:hypothetical protein